MKEKFEMYFEDKTEFGKGKSGLVFSDGTLIISLFNLNTVHIWQIDKDLVAAFVFPENYNDLLKLLDYFIYQKPL